eukprot:scaffold71688_cov19-Tisochrysis_lutea.AAC.1
MWCGGWQHWGWCSPQAGVVVWCVLCYRLYAHCWQVQRVVWWLTTRGVVLITSRCGSVVHAHGVVAGNAGGGALHKQ